MRFPKTIASQAIPFKWQELAASLPMRSDLHLARKLWHASMGLFAAYVFHRGMEVDTALLLLGSLFFFVITVETLRFYSPRVNGLCLKLFKPLLRGHEMHSISTVSYFLASSLIAVAFFPRPIAVLSLSYLALGDPIASLVGILTRKYRIKLFGDKSLYGSLGCFTVCALITSFYLRRYDIHGLDLIRISLLAGLSASLAEGLPLGIDDNFTIPVISGFLVWLGMWLLSIPLFQLASIL